MTRDHIDVRDELTLDEFEGLEVIELPERELMCGCGGTGLLGGLLGGIGGASSAGVGINANVNVALGIGAGSSTACGS